MKINCVIIDDEPIAVKGLVDYVNQIGFLELKKTFTSSVEAAIYLNSNEIDVVFIDIQMPVMTGIEVVQGLEKRPMIIFTTAYREYGPEGFELEAIDYLVKPISFPRFLKAATRAFDKSMKKEDEIKENDDHVFIKSDGKFIKVKFHEILYLESDRDYVYIHTKGQKFMALLALKQIEQTLPQIFLRCHRSFIINPEFVESIEGNQIKIGDRLIPISRTYQDGIFDKLIKDRIWKR